MVHMERLVLTTDAGRAHRALKLSGWVFVTSFALATALLFPKATHAAPSESYQQADARLNALYRQLKALSSPEDWKVQVEEERKWIKERDEDCTQPGSAAPNGSHEREDCLRIHTEDRIKVFEMRIAEHSQKSPAARPLLAGGWSAWMCPAGVKEDPDRCSMFAIFLYDRAGQLCGLYTYVGPAAERADAGGTPSIIGRSNGAEATVVAQSDWSDPPVRVHAQMTLKDNRLHWKSGAVDIPKGSSGEYWIPDDVWLNRTSDSVVSDKVLADLHTACNRPSPAFPGSN
jgi:hypothetical protein